MVLCQKHIKQQHEKDKRIYANMFQKFAEQDSKVKDCYFLQQPQEGGIAMFSNCQTDWKVRNSWFDLCVCFFFSLEQKAEKVKGDTKENGNDAMEIDNTEKGVESEAKA